MYHQYLVAQLALLRRKFPASASAPRRQQPPGHTLPGRLRQAAPVRNEAVRSNNIRSRWLLFVGMFAQTVHAHTLHNQVKPIPDISNPFPAQVSQL
jgi:hypothetical protein